MKRMKSLLAILTLLLFAVTVQAQVTPQAIIGQAPALPSVNNLVVTNVSYDKSLHGAPFEEKVDNAYTAIKTFHDNIGALEEKSRETAKPVEAAIGGAKKQEADRLAKQMTGRSTAQLQNMNEKQMEAMGSDLVAQRLAAAGLGNMSLADLKALEGKSQEEVMASLGNANPTQAGTPPKATAAQTKETADLERINKQKMNIQVLNNQTTDEALVELKKIYDKHSEALTKRKEIAREYFEGYMDHRQYTHDQYAVAQRDYESVQEAYLTESYTYWLGVVASMQERTREMIAQVPETKNPSANVAGLVAYDFAGLYLDLTRSAAILPSFI